MREMTDEQWLAWLRERQASRLTVYNDVDRLLGILEKRDEEIARLQHLVREGNHALSVGEVEHLRAVKAAAKAYREAEIATSKSIGVEQRDIAWADVYDARDRLDELLKVGNRA